VTIQPGFTLCFLLHDDAVLMLHRRFPPNQGLWNGVGGHIEPGETPREAAVREIEEETGYQVTDPRFAGLLTWEGFEIPPGAIAIFIADVPDRNFLTNHEGELAWQPRNWACTAPGVVDNIHVFLPKILAGEPPLHYHFSYRNGVRIKDVITPLPEDFDLDVPYRSRWDIFEEQRGDFLLSFDKDRLQMDIVEDFLAKHAYWAQGRPRHVIEKSIRCSVCLGIYHKGVQAGFARLVTDKATFAWLCDVFVDKEYRGQGLGKWLIDAVCRYCDSQGIKRTFLASRDAQGLYEKYGGFQYLDNPGKWMFRFPNSKK